MRGLQGTRRDQGAAAARLTRSRDGVRPSGRFAPSPTGPLHLGSLLAATASYVDARAQGLAWQLRFDDLDAPRNQPGADDRIMFSLEKHGLDWDGPVVRQSEHVDRYQAALDRLAADGRIFYCDCTRSMLAGQRRYPGTCRGHRQPASGRAARVQVSAEAVAFDDAFLGPRRASLTDDVGDFVVWRRDGIPAYQLATAVDDGAEDIVRVVRGRDLLDNTPRQIWLMRLLGLKEPGYGHLPLLRDQAGRKLSKQNHAPALNDARPAANLARVLGVLGMALPADAASLDCQSVLRAAVAAWPPAALPRADALVETAAGGYQAS